MINNNNTELDWKDKGEDMYKELRSVPALNQ